MSNLMQGEEDKLYFQYENPRLANLHSASLLKGLKATCTFEIIGHNTRDNKFNKLHTFPSY